MTVHVLVTGTLFRAAESKTSSSGRKYVKATLRVSGSDNSASEFWDLLAFSESAGAELLRLSDGERVAVQGSLKCKLLEQDGKPPRIIRTTFVDHVLALRAAPKEKKPKPAATPAVSLERVNSAVSAAAATSPFDDDIPF